MTALAGMRSFRNPDKVFAVTNELRTRGTDNLLAAAAEAGTRRVIAQSYTGWTNERSGGLVKTEDDPFDSRLVPSAVRTLAAIKHVEQTVPLQVPEGIVLRYGSFYGPGASQILLDLLHKRMPWARPVPTTSWTATRRRSRTGCRTWPGSRARSRRCACPPGSGGCSPG